MRGGENTAGRLNDPRNYHRNELAGLGWEQTVPAMLEDPDGPCRLLLREPASFGVLLLRYLRSVLPPERPLEHLLEIGGGEGFVMRDLLLGMPDTRATMLDLSPVMLARQRARLAGFGVQFVSGDVLQADPDLFGRADLVILNEMMGDLPTLCNVTRRDLETAAAESWAGRCRRLMDSYALARPDAVAPVCRNVGALVLLESVCTAGPPVIYLSEHSAEAEAPPEFPADCLGFHATGEPERIALYGHDEYSIRFSDLDAVARGRGYDVIRGTYAELLGPRLDDDELRIAVTAGDTSARHEMLRQFLHDLFKYEFLLLRRVR